MTRRSGRGRWVAGAVAVAAVGAIAAVGATTPWASGNGLTDAAHGGPASPSGLATSQNAGGQVSAINSTSVQKVGQPTPAQWKTHSPATPSASARPSARPTVTHPSATPTTPVSTEPVLFYDSVEPGVLPAGQAAAVYADGPFATSSASVAGHPNVLWIDVNGGDPNANVLDVEPGDATPARAALWVSSKLTADPSSVAIVYTFIAEWPSVIDSIATLPASMRSHVKYWIADPTGVPHILSGASATQWAWGSQYDSDEAEPGFFA
ncbi:MAG TPA: hypothetical protein VMU95_19070 [Trebonia sp.]|nr:hypothetical protein [Trebonia sp.]